MILYKLSQSGQFKSLTASEEDSFVWLKMLKFDGNSKKEMWKKDCGFEFIDSHIPEASFPPFVIGCLGCDESKIPKELLELLKVDGELLETELQGISCYNLMNIVDCVDLDKSQWAPVPAGETPYRLKKMEFDYKKIPRNRLFKLPKWTSAIFLLVDERDESYNSSFYDLYQHHKLNGIEYEKV